MKDNIIAVMFVIMIVSSLMLLTAINETTKYYKYKQVESTKLYTHKEAIQQADINFALKQ